MLLSANNDALRTLNEQKWQKNVKIYTHSHFILSLSAVM